MIHVFYAYINGGLIQKNATPTALKHIFRNTIPIVSCGKIQQIMHLFTANHFTFNYQRHHHPQLTSKQLPPYAWLTTPLPLRGGVGGEASFAFHYYTFNYQQRRLHNCFTTQLGTSCSFDSPGLVRDEPTPGKHPQGDSTPSVLSFFYEGTPTIKPFMADNAEKAQHLRRCSAQTIR